MIEHRGVRIGSLVALAGAAVVPFAVACGGSNGQPPNSGVVGAGSVGYGNAPPGYSGATPGAYPPGYPQATPPGYPQGTPPPGYPSASPAPSASQTPLAQTDPNSLQGILQGLQGALQGTLVAPGSQPGDVTEAGLKAQALRVAPGMQPEGDELKQNMTEGQHAVIMVTLQAGKCYSLVGYSAPGAVRDLDLNLLAPPLYMTLAGQDMTHNNTPAIGASPSPMCPVLAFPLQYKLDILAKSGSGLVAVQLYSKNK